MTETSVEPESIRTQVFNDPASAEAAMENSFCRTKIAPGGRGVFEIRDTTCVLPKIMICHQSFGGSARFLPDGPPEFVAITQTRQGRAEARFRSKSREAALGDGLITRPDNVAEIRWSDSSAFLTVKIRMVDVLERLRIIIGSGVPSTLELEPLIKKDNAQMRAWWLVVDALENIAGQPGAELASAEYEDLLITALLHGQPHSFGRLQETLPKTPAPRHVKKAIDYIEAHLTQPILLADLVAASGVSAGALNSGFQRFRDLSPMAFVRERRLEQAKARLERGESSVTQAAFDTGFSHLGRFSKVYLQKFGEMPSETLRRSRASDF